MMDKKMTKKHNKMMSTPKKGGKKKGAKKKGH